MKYVFLDIDGTLYAPSINGTPQSAIDAIAKARANGNKVFLCTGRALGECSKYLHYDVDGFVFASGAMVYVDGKRIYDCPIPKEDVTVLRNAIKDEGMGYSFEGAAGAYCNPRGYQCALSYFAGEDTDPLKIIQNTTENCFFEEKHWHEDEHIYKCVVYRTEGGSFDTLVSKMPENYILTKSVHDPKGWDGGEITNKVNSKATGIKHVLDHFNATYEDAIAVGDSANDISMLKACGLAIAMGNAFETVKPYADFVTTDILDDGIKNAFIYAKLIEE